MQYTQFIIIKLCDLRPQHLNEFYRDLAENGVRIDCVRAVPKKVIKKKVEATGAAKHIVAEQAGISHTTLNAILRGDPVKMESAKGLATALGYTVSELFTIKDKNIPLSSKTIHEHHRLISVILAMAEREMLILYNPAAKAIPPKVTKSEPIYYQPEELEDIISALDKAPLQQKTMTYILLDIGCRRGELMGLKWENVDLEKGIIMIKQALLYTKEKGVYVGPPKNGKPRAVYISPETLELLKTHKHEQLKTKIRHMNIWQDSGFVFTKNDGSPMHPDTITRWLNNFSKENNLPHLHPHAFRHTVASLLISNGIDLVTTAAELGHANATTTAMIYAHQVARSRAEAAGVRAGVFATLRQA